ncbi:hypothetical protein, partial [Mesorhizobium sp. M7A.F.Ca.CA.001.08.1.1]|uniref:hypothetical protein n=1 Tax=Mesorhizobium sp. M7A.F.Ca.CA.001.08.1.1 TaxID=2496691 RepID=UPI0019D23270
LGAVVLQPASTETAMAAKKTFLETVNIRVLLDEPCLDTSLGRASGELVHKNSDGGENNPHGCSTEDTPGQAQQSRGDVSATANTPTMTMAADAAS